MLNIPKFVKNQIPLLACTVSAAILGYLGYRIVQSIIGKSNKTEKIEDVGQKTISSVAHQKNSSKIGTPIKASTLSQKTTFRQYGDQEKSAAIKIQSLCRGHLAKIKVEKIGRYILSYALLEKAKSYINPPKLKTLSRASSGKTPVYLPEDLPIVLKQSGSYRSRTRFYNMRKARDICEKNSYQNLSIPKARVYGDFIIESKLPISSHQTKGQIGLYIENRERFTAAVKEFAGFLCQATLKDIIGGSNDPYGMLFSKTPLGRYDNLPLYLEEGTGKIALIDLEDIYFSRISGDCFSACRDAIRLFPLHFEDIISVVKTFDPHIEARRKDLEKDRNGALERFKIVYDDHLKFLEQKGVTIQDPLKIPTITSSRREKMGEAIIKMILKGSKDYERSYRKSVYDNSQKGIEIFKETFPEILNMITDFMGHIIRERMDSFKEPISSAWQLALGRTFEFKNNDRLYVELKEKIKSKLQLKIDDSSLEDCNECHARLVVQSVFTELEKEGEIAYYNPSFGPGGYASHCVFC